MFQKKLKQPLYALDAASLPYFFKRNYFFMTEMCGVFVLRHIRNSFSSCRVGVHFLRVKVFVLSGNRHLFWFVMERKS